MMNVDEKKIGVLSFEFLTFCLFFTLSQSIITIIYRLPVGTDIWPILHATLLPLAFLFSFFNFRDNFLKATAAAVALLVLPCASHLLGQHTYFISLIYGVIILFALLNMFRRKPRCSLLLSIITALFGALVGISFFLIMNTKGYANIYAPEQAIYGLLHRDTLFHAALASMISKFGVVSTGVDGLVISQYHFLSHAFYGILSKWLQLSSVDIYAIAPTLISAPLFVFLLGVSATTLTKQLSSPLIVALTPLIFLGLLDTLDPASYLISESQLIAIILLLLGFPLLHDLSNAQHKYARLSLLVILATLCLLAKISVGIIFVTVLAWLILRTKNLSIFVKALALVALAGISYSAHVLVTPRDHVDAAAFYPFHFITHYRDAFWHNFFAIFIMIALCFLSYRKVEYSKKIFFEALIIGALTALIPTLLLQVAGGSVYYFLHVGTILACVTLPFWVNVHKHYEKLVLIILMLIYGGCFYFTPTKANSLKNLEQIQASLESASKTQPQAMMFHTSIKQELLSTPNAIIFIDPNFKDFWERHKACNANAFIFPAYYGAPVIYGLPPAEQACDVGNLHGYYAYDKSHTAEKQQSAQQLCSTAQAYGFKAVLHVKNWDDIKPILCER